VEGHKARAARQSANITVSEKYPVQIKKGNKAEADCPAGGRIVGSDPGEFAVQQVQPD
jgi:hypothetical protein